MKWLWSSWLTLVLLLAAGAASADSGTFLRAQEAWRKGNLKALAGYAAIMDKDPLGMYPRFWLLESGLASADNNGQIIDFLAANKGSWLAERLRVDWLRSLGWRRDWVNFRIHYPLLTDTPSNELLCYNFQARLDAGDKRALPDARNILWFAGKDLPASCDPVLAALVSSNTVVESDMWARLRLAFEANNASLIRSLSKTLNEEVPQANLNLLMNSPERYLGKAPLGTRMGRELAIYALARLGRTDLDGALAGLTHVQEGLGTQVNYAWRVLAVTAARRGDARALAWFKASTGLPYTDFQQDWRVRAALRAGDWDVVVDGIRGMSDDCRNQRAWQYWLARAMDAKGMGAYAVRIYAVLSQDDDYYGLLARDRLGTVAQPTPAPPWKAGDEDLARLKANAGLQRALMLYELDARPEATKEWNWALRGADDRLLLAAAEQANAVGWYDRAIYAAERTQKLTNYSLRYVAPYRDVTKGYAQDLNLDEAWVYGLMRQESRFVNSAQSGVGAQGLMQLMPATARWVARKLGLHYHAEMTNEIGGNVQLGTYYLRHVLESLNNNEVLATAAYNAGPSRARDWQGDKPLEAAVYIEGIPFFETRDYVRKVMTNAVYYAQGFGQPGRSLTQRLGTIPPRGGQPIEGP
jgi:soluble lytic murein transglycosylase